MQYKLLQASLAFASFLTLIQTAPTQWHGTPSPGSNHFGSSKAIYFITNDAQNAVAAVPIGADGMLSGGTVTATGGSGGNSISAATKEPAGPDALISQSSLTIAGNVRNTFEKIKFRAALTHLTEYLRRQSW